MKKLTFVVVVAACGLLAGEALATKIETTRASVDQQCGKRADGTSKNYCQKKCGQTTCIYHCEGDRCTVEIQSLRGRTGGAVRPGGRATPR